MNINYKLFLYNIQTSNVDKKNFSFLNDLIYITMGRKELRGIFFLANCILF